MANACCRSARSTIRLSLAASMRSITPVIRTRPSSCYPAGSLSLVATRSGITLAGEGGAHQSIAEPLIGLAQDGLASFEPAYVDELAVIMQWAFSYMQKDGDVSPSETNWLRDETGGS